MKKKTTLIIAIILAAAAIIPGALWLKQYYDENYVREDYYYTVVPLDYDMTPEKSYSMKGEFVGYHKDYTLTGYNADGQAREIEFRAMQDLYAPGTYVRLSMSKTTVLGQNALAGADVPAAALAKLKEGFTPSAATTLEEYAAERTGQLGARNTSSLTISCAVKENTLVYTYTYSAGAKEQAQEAAELLDIAYQAQFKADKAAFPGLTAISLEVRLDDGAVIASKKYE
jgi:uncharacterized protein YxeA